ncbi:serine hydrolase domain-containing protein [Legionella nagasakiensis]|uniref:serine hydrolase domain-containing protein n=1 Tax=Legionella nagasakiensis TaxID=535290 RepID=UPI0010547049|nr:serine hydrolase [Legionella nagasakiensis]
MNKLIIALFLWTGTAMAISESKIDSIIGHHFKKYSQLEHFSAIQVSIKAAGKLTHYAVGTRSIESGSPPITPHDLFNIGSITKSFTAALAVIAESEDKLHLQDKLSQHLKQYPHWSNLSLTQLLNMSSGIPNYSDAPKINYLMSVHLKQYWDQAELVDLVYPQRDNPPLKSGYFYSNTGYILMDMILTNQYQKPYKQLLQEKILSPLKLKNTFYPIPQYSVEMLQRMVHGYSYNIYDNPELLGRDVTENNLSWAGAAGGLVANSEDVIHWVDALFVTDAILTPEQKHEMQTLISVSDGQPMKQPDTQSPRGFGLGIVGNYDKEIGVFWLYEGETLGYRALYMYVPKTRVIIAALFNSATNSENDHSGELMLTLYREVLRGQESHPAESTR